MKSNYEVRIINETACIMLVTNVDNIVDYEFINKYHYENDMTFQELMNHVNAMVSINNVDKFTLSWDNPITRNGTAITDPSLDESGRFEVPKTYYYGITQKTKGKLGVFMQGRWRSFLIRISIKYFRTKGDKKMKTFNVFYDVKIAGGVLEERSLTVHNVNFKIDAIHIFREKAPKNAIFRCVKKPLDLI